MRANQKTITGCLLGSLLTLAAFHLPAHGVDAATKSFLSLNQGVAAGPFLYIGAKHMITGYDHLLFLAGVIFFLYRLQDILIYVTLFTLGHSTTLLGGVLLGLRINPYLIDAVIGFSIVYKAFDNLGGFKLLTGFQPDTKIAVTIFGLFHGFGLATKLQEFAIPQEGLWKNLLAFNAGVEIGQFFSLFVILIFLEYWRRSSNYNVFSNTANVLLMTGGWILTGYQLTGYFVMR